MEGFDPVTALEPGAGSGNFLGLKPELEWTTVDIDKTNSQVLESLYPEADHYNMSFENLY